MEQSTLCWKEGAMLPGKHSPMHFLFLRVSGTRPTGTDARITVLKGTLYLGYGDLHNEQALQSFGVGSYVLVPAEAKHFDGSSEDTLIIGTAVGPWSTFYVDPGVKVSAGTQK